MIKFWIAASRIYTSPMTILSWLVIFCYCLTKDGNVLYGILALIGVCFAHLATNVFDDYIDYKKLENTENFKNAKNNKCAYLKEFDKSIDDVLNLFFIYILIASFIGLFFLIKIGWGVLVFAGLAGIIALLYPLLGKFRLCEIAVALTYGPLLFGGVYYVMTKSFDINCLILSVPTMIMTVNLLYTSTIMDFDNDKINGKKTLANSFETKEKSLDFQKKLIFLGYLSIFLICIFDISDWEVFLTYLTFPLAINLTNSLKEYIKNPNYLPKQRWFNFPMGNFENNKSASFLFRMFQTRNLMVYFATILSISLLFD